MPKGAIATVDGVPIIKAQFDQYIDQAKASAGQNGSAAFPSPGTATYNRYAAEIVNYLVEQQVVLNAAAKGQRHSDRRPGAKPTHRHRRPVRRHPEDVRGRQEGRHEPKPAQDLHQGLARRPEALPEGRRNAKPTAAQMQAYYKAHKSSYDKPATRTVRHVLVKTKAEAETVRALLVADNTNANWAKVAKKYSTDTATKNSGGSLGAIQKGEMVKPFENAAFSLALDAVSQPVHSQYGWHVLEVTKITAAKKSTYASAKSSVQSTLKSQISRRPGRTGSRKAQKAAKILYAVGFDPSALTASPSPSPSSSPSAGVSTSPSPSQSASK